VLCASWCCTLCRDVLCTVEASALWCLVLLGCYHCWYLRVHTLQHHSVGPSHLANTTNHGRRPMHQIPFYGRRDCCAMCTIGISWVVHLGCCGSSLRRCCTYRLKSATFGPFETTTETPTSWDCKYPRCNGASSYQ